MHNDKGAHAPGRTMVTWKFLSTDLRRRGTHGARRRVCVSVPIDGRAAPSLHRRGNRALRCERAAKKKRGQVRFSAQKKDQVHSTLSAPCCAPTAARINMMRTELRRTM